MKHISLFSGMGGFDLAAEWLGWENIANCEWNTFCQMILKYYWPNAISYADITKTDFSVHRGNIDIVTGGFPCQPYSLAGLRKGKDDDRHLWPHMLRAVREIKPRWVVGENVLGLVGWNGGLVFQEVQADLEAEGYEVQPYILPAAAVNAPHRRDRVWFVAHSHKRADSRTSRQDEGESTKKWLQKRDKVWKPSKSGDVFGDVTYSNNSMRSERGNSRKWKSSEQKSKIWDEIWNNPRPIVKSEHAADPNCGRQSGEEHGKEKSRFSTEEGIPDYWHHFPTQSPVRHGNDGFSTDALRQYFLSDSNGVISEKEIDQILSKAATEWRNESIKAGGNAIVPQVALQIFKAIMHYELSAKQPIAKKTKAR